ncbi:hypothetical protein MWN43_10800 [Ornithobacterium rhinotracheale]|nr:hypothetical protein [Ornithobacterium rhinotracheale]MCK0195198.1 hypothetical protein [Ornithobacterium rhinotracheale]
MNTTTPNASWKSLNDELFKKDETQAQGVTFPNFSTEERSKFENVAVGTMIFNTTKKCLEMYFGLKVVEPIGIVFRMRRVHSPKCGDSASGLEGLILQVLR